MRNISLKQKQLLEAELLVYEQKTQMTPEEKSLLHEWVASGHSVHENGSFACYEGGRSVDFLEVYRAEQEEERLLATISDAERKTYLYEEYGVGRTEDPNWIKELENLVTMEAMS